MNPNQDAILGKWRALSLKDKVKIWARSRHASYGWTFNMFEASASAIVEAHEKGIFEIVKTVDI